METKLVVAFNLIHEASSKNTKSLTSILTRFISHPKSDSLAAVLGSCLIVFELSRRGSLQEHLIQFLKAAVRRLRLIKPQLHE
jgi:hypothetical protein